MNAGFVFLGSSVLCSVTVSILLKLARRYDVDVRQAIAANYVVAVVLCIAFLSPSLGVLTAGTTPWAILIALGVLLPTVFLAMANAVRHAGIVRSDAAQRLSLFIPLLAAFFLFGQSFSLRTGAAIALGLMALACLLKRPAAHPTGKDAGLRRADVPAGQSFHGALPQHAPSVDEQRLPTDSSARWIWPLAVWLGYGVIDVLFKQVARTGTAFSSGLLVAFTLAGGLTFVYLIVKRTQWRAAYLGAGVLLGCLNFANIYTYIRAHQSLPNDPALVFSAMNIGVISIGTLAGALLFKEKLSPLNMVGLVLAVAAVILMTP